MIYDGDCGFCRRWIARWQAETGDRVAYAPSQDVRDHFTQIPPDAFNQAVYLVEPDGSAFSAAHAVFKALAYVPGRRKWLWLYRHVPGVAFTTEAAYRFVAGHRRGFSRVTSLLWGADVKPPTYLLSRWLFVRLMGAIYFIAFVSLGMQIDGLIGSNGILPASDYLNQLRQQFGTDAYWRFPTLMWLDCSDATLQWSCWGGAIAAVLVVLRIAPAFWLVLLWALYLSLFRVGQVFLSFQWDLLLLEAGLLAILYAPWQLLPRLRSERKPSPVPRWLIWWLLFRLMFCSGVVKLLADDSNNPTWHQLTALNYHYETQPLPTWIGWYAHQLPEWFQMFSVFAMFVIEIGAPFLIFTPRNPRFLAFVLIVFLMVLIGATGNYNFFNLLAIALCIPLLDDARLRRLFPKRCRSAIADGFTRRRDVNLQRLITGAAATLILAVSGIWMVETFVGFRGLPESAQSVLRYSMRLESVNNYGLFRRMTTDRPEIIIEGSRDGRTWLPYEFKWKPGDPARRPAFVEPHQPRLDWQMWFAALGTYRGNWWLIHTMKKLLEGALPVLALLEENPFPEQPPKYVRAVKYDYRFTDRATRAKEATWWRRERIGLYAPVLSLESFRDRR